MLVSSTTSSHSIADSGASTLLQLLSENHLLFAQVVVTSNELFK